MLKSYIFFYGSIGLTFSATLLHIIAYASPGWAGDSQYHEGLWYSCVPAVGCHPLQVHYERKARLDAARAMESLALIAYLVSCAAATGFILKRKDFMRLTMITAAVTGGFFALIGVIVYGTIPNMRNLYYSFGLCIVGALLGFTAGAFGFLAKELKDV